MLETQNAHDFLNFSHLVAPKSTFSYLRVFLMNLKIGYLKIDVSCEVSVSFHHMSQNPTPAPELARCYQLTQPRQCDSQKHATYHDMSKAVHVPHKMTMEVSKVLPLPRKAQVIFWKHRKGIIAPLKQRTFDTQ